MLNAVKKIFSKNKAETPRLRNGKQISRQPYDILLEPYNDELNEIYELTGLSRKFFDHLYMVPIQQYAEVIQLLPASEAHHHSQPGGMLQHTIEIILNALRLRRGQILPPGVIPEEVEQRKDLWTYVVFLCALFHDVGKVISDVNQVDPKGKKWNLLSKSSPPERYEIRFNPKRKHKFHEKLPAFVLFKFVAPSAIEWIMKDDEAFYALINFMIGDHAEAGVVSDLIQKSDQASVVGNLGGDISKVTAKQAQRPLSERILRTIQTLVAEDRVPVNRRGAACYIDGDFAYFVVKRLLDDVKERMRQDGQSVPDRNDRLMDELQQFEVIEANADKAIWKAKVFVDDWNSDFSMLKMKLSKVWPSIDNRPEPNSSIRVVEAGSETKEKNDDSQRAQQPEERSNPKKSAVNTNPTSKSEAIKKPVAEPSEPEKKLPTEQKLPTSKEANTLEAIDELNELDEAINASPDNLQSEGDDDAFVDDFGIFDDAPEPSQIESKNEVSPLPEQISDRDQIMDEIMEKTKGAIGGAVKQHNDKVFQTSEVPIDFNNPDSAGAKFIHWLVDGIKSGSIEINQPSNRVHMVSEGLFLASPAIFRQFDSETGISWDKAQREVSKLKINLKTQKGENIFKYEIESKSGRTRPKVIKGYLIPNPDKKLGLVINSRNEWMKQIT
ncbi:hypothetical protein CYQ88_08440 [Hydrogenovibrio sp. SC-1]|uniref:MobH family relaxase n=1 Tax=Hydrogenovibrio sp. SC-1 TaxID=2065820 RepID=UPI000C7A5B2D|nr:MobH family relaxase [Hydrogenovibrio sp. SC-1]PLA73983.1 hypothetical protein CYQ88_08440 [Hydrogenovibrio sp. SC-1]